MDKPELNERTKDPIRKKIFDLSKVDPRTKGRKRFERGEKRIRQGGNPINEIAS
jgi:hypothetical protein